MLYEVITYAYSNIINVAASNWFDELESYSSWSSTSVDLCAPGTNILSTTAIDSYAYYSGTSMAAPHVTGVAALVKSIRSDWDANMLKSAILGTVDPIASASGKTVTGGRLNAFAARITSYNVCYTKLLRQGSGCSCLAGLRSWSEQAR